MFRHFPSWHIAKLFKIQVPKRFQSSILESVLSTDEFTPSAKAPLEVPSLLQLGLCHVVPLCKSWQQKPFATALHRLLKSVFSLFQAPFQSHTTSISRSASLEMHTSILQQLCQSHWPSVLTLVASNVK